MMFAKKNVRRGLLDKMLSELLDTRVMVKGSMKAVASDRVRRCLVRSVRSRADPTLRVGAHQAAQRPPTRAQISRQRAWLA